MNERAVTSLRRVMRAMVSVHGKEKTIELWRAALLVRSSLYPHNFQDSDSPAKLEIRRALRFEFPSDDPQQSQAR